MPRTGFRGEVTSALALVAALAATARPVRAQVEWQVDAAASRVKPVGAVARNAVSFAAQAQQEFGPFKPLISLASTLTSDSVAAAQLSAGFRATPPWNRRMPIDLGAVVSLYGIAAGDRGQSRGLYLRQHSLGELGEQKGWWIGGGIAQIERSQSFASHAIDAGGWIARGRTQYLASVSTSRTDDRELFRTSTLEPDEFASGFRVADATFSLVHARTFVDLEAVAGVRLGVEGLKGTRGFGAVSIRYRLQQIVYVFLGGGTQLADPLRGSPEWGYLTVGMRIGNTRPRIVRPAGLVGPPLRYERVDTLVRFIVDAEDAEIVELMGTMTGGEPRTLVRTEEGWVVTMPAPSGGHQVQVRVNGGAWLPPAGVGTVIDEFGRRVGYLVLL